MNTCIKIWMYASLEWNIKTFNIKRNTTTKNFKTKKKVFFYKYKGSPSVSCKKPHIIFFIYFPLE